MILHALSGGIDSFAACHKLLKEGHEVHAHHVVLRTKKEFWIPELRVVRKIIVPYFEEAFPGKFTVSESSIDLVEADHCKLQLVVPISLQLACVAGGKKNVACISRGYLGHSKAEATNRPLVEHMYKRLVGYCIPEIYPVLGCRKKDLYNASPVEVRDKLWSCFTPIRYENGGTFRYCHCRECRSCREYLGCQATA